METTSFNVPNVSCSNCAAKITDTLKTMKGVSNVAIDRKTQNVKVDYDAASLDASRILKAVSQLGYEIIQ